MSAEVVGESSGIERGTLTAEDADRLASSFRAAWEDLDEGQITAGSAILPDDMDALIAPATAAPLVNVANLSKTLPMPVRSPAAGMKPVAHAQDSALEDDVLPKKSGRGLIYGAVGAVAALAIGVMAVNSLRSKDVDPRAVEPANTSTVARDIPAPATADPAKTAAAAPKAVETQAPVKDAPAKAEPPKTAAKAEPPAPTAKVEPPKAEAPKAAPKAEPKEAPKAEPKTASAPPKAPTAQPAAKAPAAAPAEPKTAPKAPQSGIVRDTPF